MGNDIKKNTIFSREYIEKRGNKEFISWICTVRAYSGMQVRRSV